MVGTHTSTETTVDVFFRAGGTSSWTQQQRVIDRLDRLEEAGAIDRYRIQVWAPAAPLAGPLSETRFHRSATGVVGKFEDWAASRDAETSLPFERDEVVCEFTDDHHRVVRLPVVCLAVYEDGSLVGVYPRAEEGKTYPVEDLLERMDANAGPTDIGSDAGPATERGGPRTDGTPIGSSSPE